MATFSNITLFCYSYSSSLFSQSLETTSEKNRGKSTCEVEENTLLNTNNLHSWSIANLDNICWNWSGISCNNGGDVYKIKLDNFSLSGTLESFDFLSFPNLNHFSLYNNSFYGPIPYAIVNLSQLVLLDLRLNRFVNSIPPEIGRLRNLQFLNLGFNNLDASERTEGRALLKWKNTLSNAHVLHSWSIANLDNICWNWTGINCNNVGDVYGITLVDFSLSGTLESFDFISFPNLIHFNLHNNSFIGSIPYAIANLSRLDFLDLSLNRFVNFIPPEIGRLRNLQFLNLGFNNLVAWKHAISSSYTS
nr:receptor like protein 30-like [Ipomoea batatas]